MKKQEQKRAVLKKQVKADQALAKTKKYPPPKMAQRTLEERDYDAALAAKAKAKKKAKGKP